VSRSADGDGLQDEVQESIAMLVGPLLFARLTESMPLDERPIDRALAQFLAAHRS
jgi:hypothetical protein